jgi:hypothetical protein
VERVTESGSGEEKGRLVLVAAAAATALWLVARVAGIDLAVHAGDGSREVGLVSVIVTVVVVAIAATGLLRVLERRTTNGRRTWTIIAVTVWALSFLGPMTAMTVAAGLALAAMHLTVGAVVVGGLRRTRVA